MYKDYDVVKYDNFYEMLYGVYAKYKSKLAIRYRVKEKEYNLTYDELTQQVSNLYNYFKIHNIKDENIGILSENRYEYITIYLATVFDNVIAPIDKELMDYNIQIMLDKFDIKTLFYTNKMKSKIESLLSFHSIRFINIDEFYKTMIDLDYQIDTFFEDIKKVDNNKFSVLSFTSGTTGEIKGVMLSQKNVVSNIRAPLLYMHLESPMLQLLPMNHTYGFNPDTLSPFYNGNTICINMALKDIVKDFKYYNPYYIGVVPMMLEGIYNNIIREARRQNKEKLLYKMIKLSNTLRKLHIDIRHLLFGNLINKRLKIIVCGGAALDPMYVQKFDELGIIVLNGYGLTECSPLIAVNKDRDNVWGSVGTIIRGTNVKIAKDGEILVKGDNVMLGYYKNSDETKKAFEGKYYKTGDIGYKKGDILYVTGRKKNLIILKNGKNFSPEVLEKELLRLPYVKECLVVASKKKKIDIVLAKILLDGNGDNLDKDIKEINKKMPDYMKIDDYEIVQEEFLKTSTKKIIRSKYVK